MFYRHLISCIVSLLTYLGDIQLTSPNPDSVKKMHSIDECESGFGFGESCLNLVLVAT